VTREATLRRNFDLSTALVGIGALAVIVSLFLDWYTPGLRAWDVFEFVDWALFALAVGALIVLAGEAAGTAPPSQRLAWICGIVALIVIAEILDPPPAARDAARELGAWIALAGSALMVVGVVLAMAEISVSIDVAERERRRRTAAVDARPGDDDGESPAAASGGPGPGPGDEAAPGRRGELWGGGGRPGDEDDGAPAPARGRGPAAPGGPPARPAAPPPPPPASGPAPADRPATPPAEDPDRTQPFSPPERPDGEG
jgi:hypothetical protein